MALRILLVFGLAPVLLLCAVLGIVELARRPAPSPSQAAEAARRHAGIVSGVALGLLVGALVLGAAIVNGSASGLSHGRYLGLVPAGAGLAFAAAHAIGELTWPRPTGTVRRAALARRTVADVAPTWLRRVTWAWAAVACVTLVVCGFIADDDGRGISRTYPGGAAGAGPFPGWFYGVPLLIAVVVVLAAAEGVLRLVAHRPAVMNAAPEWDLALRRLSAHRVLRGAQLVLGWTTAGVLFFAGNAASALGRTGTLDVPSEASSAYATVGLVGTLLGLVVGVGCVVVALTSGRPATSEPRSLTASPVGAEPA